MVNTEETAKQLVITKAKNEDIKVKKQVSDIISAAVMRLENEGRLDYEYPDEKSAVKSIAGELIDEDIEQVIKRKYHKESEFDPDPAIAVKWGIVTANTERVLGLVLDRVSIGLVKERNVTCECGTACEFWEDYKGKGARWICPSCGAHVGGHRGTNIPLGIPASGEISRKRIVVHDEINRLLTSGMDKKSVYKILARRMNLSAEETHAGKFSLEQCEQAISILKELKGGYRV